MTTLSEPPERQPALRRLFDAVIAGGALVLLSPFFLIIALLIVLESRGGVFYRQKRLGKDEAPFEILKFRSMRPAAPGEETVQTQIEDMDSFVFRPVGRVTRAGKLLRASSLDELPNLINVLRGEMSIVGPRPDEPELVAQYRPEWHRRHRVKPGITGLAQINGRTDLTYSEMMAYDLDYVDRHPFWRDVQIMLKTFGVVFRREGAR